MVKLTQPMTSLTPSKDHWGRWFLLVLAIALIQRAILWLSYPAGIYHDTGGYRRLADTILGGWQFYDGTRTPGYPLWMAWMGPDARVYFSQLVLGLAITMGFFFIGWQAARSPAFGAAAALAHTLNLGQLFFEANLLTETLTTFWLVLVLGSVAVALRWQGPRRWLVWLCAGGLAAFAGLTRSLFLFLPFWVGLFLSFGKAGPQLAESVLKSPVINRIRRMNFNWRSLLVVSLPGIVLIGTYCYFLYQRYGVFNVTTIAGFHLVQHTGQWFELLPDEYAALRDTFLQYRDLQIVATGSPGNTIWDAQPALEKASGLGYVQLSNLLTRLSIQLIVAHPDRYLLSVLDGWQLFWRAPVYWQPEAVSLPVLRSALEAIVLVQRILLVAANLVFLVTSILMGVSRRWRERLGLTPWWAFVLLTVWLTSVLQSLPDHGDNPRFLVPLQSWAVLWVIWVAWRLFQIRGRARGMRENSRQLA